MKVQAVQISDAADSLYFATRIYKNLIKEGKDKSANANIRQKHDVIFNNKIRMLYQTALQDEQSSENLNNLFEVLHKKIVAVIKTLSKRNAHMTKYGLNRTASQKK